ncbi:MAG TPA: hypothetical protein VFC51_09465 [Chloroflexota bacterium]|nr:hypothetical protein [Chloroflexota bacterium]
MHLRFMLPSFPWTRALETGRIEIPGVTYECAPFIENAPDRFAAFALGGYDVGEDSVRGYIVKRLRGAAPVALPVFLDREHMQRNIFVRADSSLRHPRDLIGKRVGTRQSLQSGTCAGVLMMLESGYGIALDQIQWHAGSPPERAIDRMPLDVIRGPRTDRENLDLLLRGELDAVISNLEGRYWSLFGPDLLDHETVPPAGIRPLVEDPTVIANTYRDTGLYPITDVVVVRRELIAEQPELPIDLVGAFTEANALASEYRSGIEDHLARLEVDLLGEDPHVYGLNAKARRNLDLFVDLLYRLEAIDERIGPEEIFEGRAW